MTDRERLRQVIRDLHGVDSTHLRSERIHEKAVWGGVVEVFTVYGHPWTTLAYAWSYETDAGGRRDVVVLGVHPIQSVQDAVRVSIAAERRKP